MSTSGRVLTLAGDVAEEGPGPHLLVEGLAALALLVAVVLGALLVYELLSAARRDEAVVALASGALSDLIRSPFDKWQLTPAEADVPLFAIKGCDTVEIARLRGSMPRLAWIRRPPWSLCSLKN